ncbi:MAG: hypothetical protein GKR95_09885 [Gammaproteobacteria bacterium]|nr:hypothetical protein [Gammaproteobacteria bacterium]
MIGISRLLLSGHHRVAAQSPLAIDDGLSGFRTKNPTWNRLKENRKEIRMQKDEFNQQQKVFFRGKSDYTAVPTLETEPHKEPITLIYRNRNELKSAHLPFIDDGGLFIPTHESYTMGEVVLVKVDLPDNNEPLVLSARVVWKMPRDSQNGAPMGVGVNFPGSAGAALAHCINGLLNADTK